MQRDEAEELRDRLLDIKRTPVPHDDWAEGARLQMHTVEVEPGPDDDWLVAVRFDQGEYRHLYRHRHLDRERRDPLWEAVAVIWHEVICEPHGDLPGPADEQGLYVSSDDG